MPIEPEWATFEPTFTTGFTTLHDAVPATPRKRKVVEKPKVEEKERVYVDKKEPLLVFHLSADCQGYLFFKIYKQNTVLIPFFTSRGFAIRINSSPEVDSGIYLRGDNKRTDDRMCIHNCSTKSGAEFLKSKILEALLEYTNYFRKEPVRLPLFSMNDVYEL